jgi:valyl-tRNA synthetase
MPHDLPKAYDPTAIEDHWAEYWVREKLFAQPTPKPASASEASARPPGKGFTILLPPPNVTGRLHMGHMLNQTEMDILTRWHRMSGAKSGRGALWLPGTDHAGIATQMMVERQLTEEGTSRQKLGREAFVERVWEWRRHYGGAILDQMKRLGASVDWSREYFTMDERLSVAVREAFVRLYEQGLIYRGAYIVNWCPRCQTAISDLEVVHDEHKGHLWEIRYPVLNADGKDTGEFLTVATTRPETMLGDVAVAIHPEDERYLHLHGKKLRLPLMNREILIVLDEWVSREFGTGAVKVTPAHDPNDFALGQRHHLPSINVMDDTGHINAEGGPYAGLDRYAARKKIVQDLEERELLAGIKDHTSNVGHCDRCKTVVEPRLSTQWFIKIQPLAEKAIAAVKPGPDGKKAINFTPEQYEKTYLNWMENIHDWCISRQLWWGHRIPAWHCTECHKITVARPNASPDPAACVHCGSTKITQETDVLDTWFSSGLLPVSVFGWPNFTQPQMPGAPSFPRTSAERVGDHDSQPSGSVKGTGFSPYINSPSGEGALAPEGQDRSDFDAFYPTSLLVTGFDILFFWVARMIMLGCWFAGDVPMPDGSKRTLADSVPFREVYIHALVRDANREKMSKTKGNVIDPIEIVKQYGTDAVRFTLASMASPGTDIAFNVARTEGYRAFANKIWNAARFIFMNVDRAAEIGITVDPAALGGTPTAPEDAPLEDRWIVDAFQAIAARVNASLEGYRYDEAASYIYQFFWGSFCDTYIEIAKVRLDFSDNPNNAQINSALSVLVGVLEASLRLLSPFMPFITEEIWQQLFEGDPPERSIALAQYPGIEIERLELANRAQNDPNHPIRQMDRLLTLKTELLSLRKEMGVEERASVPIVLDCPQFLRQIIEKNCYWFVRLAKVSEIKYDQGAATSRPEFKWRFGTDFAVAVIYERPIDVPAERDRLTKEIAKYEKGLASAERQLGNAGFLAKAPANVVEGLKKQESETRLLLEKAKAALEALPKD